MNASACMSHLRTASSLLGISRISETLLAFSPSTRISRKMRRHKRGMSFSRSNAKANSLDRSMAAYLFRDRCDIGMLTASENIGQLECVIVLIKFEDFLFHHGLGHVLGIRFDRRVQRNGFAKLRCLPLRYPGRRTDASKDRCKPLFSPGTDCHSTLARTIASSTTSRSVG